MLWTLFGFYQRRGFTHNLVLSFYVIDFGEVGINVLIGYLVVFSG